MWVERHSAAHGGVIEQPDTARKTSNERVSSQQDARDNMQQNEPGNDRHGDGE